MSDAHRAGPGRFRGARRGLGGLTGAWPLFIVVALLTAGCQATDRPRLGFPTPITQEGLRTLSLWQGSWVAAILVGLVVWALIIWASIFHRKRTEELPPQVRYNVPIEVLYTVLPFVIIAVLFFFTARDESILVDTSRKPDQTVNVVGKKWTWDFNYLDQGVYDTGTPAAPPTLWLVQGQRVEFILTSPDVIHSFWVPAFLFKMDVIPGRQNKFQVVPTTVGEFTGRCAEFCGVDHARMLLTVKVVTQQEFQAHIEDLRRRGQTLQGSTPQGLGPEAPALAQSSSGSGRT